MEEDEEDEEDLEKQLAKELESIKKPRKQQVFGMFLPPHIMPQHSNSSYSICSAV